MFLYIWCFFFAKLYCILFKKGLKYNPAAKTDQSLIVLAVTLWMIKRNDTGA